MSFYNEIHQYYEEVRATIVKSIGFLLGLAFVSILKVKLSNKEMTLIQAAINFLLSYFCGVVTWFISLNPYAAILSSLIGDQVVKYILMKFNSKNIDSTIEKIIDKTVK